MSVTDVLPTGLTYVASTGTGCAQTSGTVTCAIGTLAPGASSTVTISAKVASSSAGTGTHQFTDTKVEAQVDLNPGETRTVSVDCGAGFVLTDGSVRTDAVDQGTGDLGSVHVLSAQGTSVSAYTATVRNDATGRAQTKLFGNCLSLSTSTDDGHAHQLVVSAPITTTAVLNGGRQTSTLDCGPGKFVIQPGFDIGGGDGRLVSSTPSTSGTGWVFVVDGSGGTTGTFSARCLDDHVTLVNGHSHTLGLEHRAQSITVAPGQTAEVQVICGDNAKGIVGDYDVDAGLIPLGNDPRPKTRVFRFYNPTGSPLTARVGLLCLDDRTGPATAITKIDNTGTVTSTTSDPNTANNSSTATINVGGSALTRSGLARVVGTAVTVRGARASIRVACGAGGPACVGVVRVQTMTGRRLASRSFAVIPRATKTVTVVARSFRTIRRAKFVTIGRDGRRSTRTLLLRHASPVTSAKAKALAKAKAKLKARAKLKAQHRP